MTEMSAEFGRINYIVIGTGINVNVPKEMVPEELRATAVSLADVAHEPISMRERTVAADERIRKRLLQVSSMEESQADSY